jgi:hypothetical protein
LTEFTKKLSSKQKLFFEFVKVVVSVFDYSLLSFIQIYQQLNKFFSNYISKTILKCKAGLKMNNNLVRNSAYKNE